MTIEQMNKMAGYVQELKDSECERFLMLNCPVDWRKRADEARKQGINGVVSMSAPFNTDNRYCLALVSQGQADGPLTFKVLSIHKDKCTPDEAFQFWLITIKAVAEMLKDQSKSCDLTVEVANELNRSLN